MKKKRKSTYIKKSAAWKHEVREAAGALLQKLLIADKTELMLLYKSIEGKEFAVALALIIYRLNVMIDGEEEE